MKPGVRKLICAVFASCLLLCVCAELFDSSGAGTVDDPLITYSYVRKTVLPALKDYMKSASEKLFSASGRENALKKHGKSQVSKLSLESLADKAADELASSVTELSVPSITGQRKLTIGERWAVCASPGATVLVVEGEVRTVPENGGTIIHVSDKKELGGETALSAGDYAVVTEAGTVLFIAEKDAVVTVTGSVSFKTPILGKLVISGDPEFGETLKADLSSVTYVGKLTYSWTIDGKSVGTGDAYTVGEADIGKKLVLTVTASGDGCGSISSAPVTVTKVAENAPAAPTLKASTYNSVTLNAVEGMEYRLGTDGKWQTSPTFTGLSENTTYRFYMRVAETDTSAASSAGKALSVTTPVRAELTSRTFKVDAANGRISGIAPGTTVAKIIKGMDYPDYVKVYDASGKEASGDAAVGTGWKVSLVVDGKVRDSVFAVVTGDVNGDGKATLTDFVQMKSHLLGKTLTGNKLLAGDINGDGSFTLTDFVNMKSFLLGNIKINGQKV